MITYLKKVLPAVFFLFISCKSTYGNLESTDLNTGYIFELYYKSDKAIDGSMSLWYAKNEEINSEKFRREKVKPNLGFANLAFSRLYHVLLCCEDEKYKNINNQKEVDSLFTIGKETVYKIDSQQSHAFFKINKNKTLKIYKVKIDYCTCSKEFSSYSNINIDKYLYVYKIQYLELRHAEKKYLSKNKEYILSNLK